VALSRTLDLRSRAAAPSDPPGPGLPVPACWSESGWQHREPPCCSQAEAAGAAEAGNSTSRTVDGIKIDRTAPVTTAHVAEPLQSGWYADDVDVTLTALDAISDVRDTYYSVDGGDAKPYDGKFAFGANGVHTIRF
jgi:hypothetical protein